MLIPSSLFDVRVPQWGPGRILAVCAGGSSDVELSCIGPFGGPGAATGCRFQRMAGEGHAPYGLAVGAETLGEGCAVRGGAGT